MRDDRRVTILARLRERLAPESLERVWLAAASAVVGVGTGAAVTAFRGLIGVIHAFSADVVAPALGVLGTWTAASIPVLGGLLVGPLVAFVIGHERHHGVAGIIEAVALDGGRLRYRRSPAKALGAAVSIGTGASVGPEDPSVQIGANLGSFLGQRFRLGDDRVRLLVVAGAAAGIAAAFGAPIAGVFFALEVILGDLAGLGVGLVLVTAVLAAVTAGSISGAAHTLTAPRYVLQSGWDLPLHLGMGALLGPCAALYVRCIDGARTWFERSRHALWIRPAIAGAAVGAAALWIPEVSSVDYGSMERVLGGAEAAVGVLLVLGFAKIALTGLCIGAGFPGGVFAPALFAGCMLGGAFGVVARAFGSDVRIGAFAMSGMAAFLAAAVHAPLTAVLLVFEITGDYGMVAAAMAAVATALVGARAIEPESVYSRPMVRRGFRRRALAPYETARALVEPGAPCAGRRVRAVTWPAGCVIARIRRGADSMSARGDTLIEAGDEVVAVVDRADADAFAATCRAPRA